MASPTQWTWVWVNSGSWWWTRRPGVLWFMVSQRVGHDWATELIDWNGHMKTRVKPSFTFKFLVWKTMSAIFSEYSNNYNTKKKEKKNCIAPMCMLSHFSRLWLCNPANCSPPGSSVRGILQEYWSGLPCPPPGDPDQGLNLHLLCFLHWQAGSLPPPPPGKPSSYVGGQHCLIVSFLLKSWDCIYF